jgi:excinuclease ABC subunit B
MEFKLTSEFAPTGDQPTAIQQLTDGIVAGLPAQTLLGVTGSGKTFTVANTIARLNKPTLVLSHNKTLAAQLYGEFKQFFPENLVEYFVSYYDYYQPEAYIPASNTYIEKDLSINQEIEKLRLSATSALLSGRRDVIVVASVSCIYGIGNPTEFHKSVIPISRGQLVSRNAFLHLLVASLYSRNDYELSRGKFRVKGDTVDVYLAYADHCIRIEFYGDEVESITSYNPETGATVAHFDHINIYPANLFVTTRATLEQAIWEIQQDMVVQVAHFASQGRVLEAKRLEERTTYDIEMMRELGYCSGIENYSRYFDRRQAGQRPFCLFDYFPEDFLLVVDESHVTIPQVRAMYAGDRSRKVNLVEYGFRLPAALDNRPLKFEEFEALVNQVIYVSATPAEYELQHSGGVIVEQLIRPTGLLDPKIEVRPSVNQIDDLLDEINLRTSRGERTLVTTLTKRMAEELQAFFDKAGVKCRYIHSDVDTLDRVDLIADLRAGVYDVLIGVNLLREGLDLPEVSLVAILDADKEGFLRSERSLVQTVGRAARNVNGMVIMYADSITESMQQTIEETERRRARQQAYNEANGIVPTQIKRGKGVAMTESRKNRKAATQGSYSQLNKDVNIAAEPEVAYMGKADLEKKIERVRKQMQKAAKEQDFMEAARLRDELFSLQKAVEEQQ